MIVCVFLLRFSKPFLTLSSFDRNFNTKDREGERGEREDGNKNIWNQQRTGSCSESKINGNIDICRILKKAGSCGKAAKHNRTAPLGWLLKFFRLPSIFALPSLPLPLIHPLLLCSPLRLGTPSFTLYLYRPCTRVCSYVFTCGWLKCAFWKPIEIESLVSSSRISLECIMLPNVKQIDGIFVSSSSFYFMFFFVNFSLFF